MTAPDALARVLLLIRHGETDWNAEGRWQGHTDIPLNETGRRQAAGVAEVLRPLGIAGVVSSDLSRAKETARIVAAALGLDIPYVDPGLRERSFGIFEGLTRDECVSRHGEAWKAWLEDQRPPPGGERRDALAMRVTCAMGRAAERVPGGGPVLLVSHGGSIRAAVAFATGETPPPVANGAVWRVDWNGAIRSAQPYP